MMKEERNVTYHKLRGKGCSAVEGEALTERFRIHYRINDPLAGLTMKEVLIKLTPYQAADFCNWLSEQ